MHCARRRHAKDPGARPAELGANAGHSRGAATAAWQPPSGRWAPSSPSSSIPCPPRPFTTTPSPSCHPTRRRPSGPGIRVKRHGDPGGGNPATGGPLGGERLADLGRGEGARPAAKARADGVARRTAGPPPRPRKSARKGRERRSTWFESLERERNSMKLRALGRPARVARF